MAVERKGEGEREREREKKIEQFHEFASKQGEGRRPFERSGTNVH